MKPAPFDYVAPTSVPDAVAALERTPGARLLAGGQSLLPLMGIREATPPVLVDLNRIGKLAYIEVAETGELAIGAMTRMHDLATSEPARRHHPILAEALRLVGHRQIRNRGTVGGSLAHADPAAELPAVALVLDASVRTASPEGGRTLSLRDLFTSRCTTALAPDEILVEVRIPAPAAGTGSAFVEVNRRHNELALVAAAARVVLDAERRVRAAGVAFAAVAETPVLTDAGPALAGARLTDATAAEAARAVTTLLAPPSDIHASGRYRATVAEVVARRALLRAAERAGDAGCR